eukprot:148425-Chlamydomonas_euryale.AAC.3
MLTSQVLVADRSRTPRPAHPDAPRPARASSRCRSGARGGCPDHACFRVASRYTRTEAPSRAHASPCHVARAGIPRARW